MSVPDLVPALGTPPSKPPSSLPEVGGILSLALHCPPEALGLWNEQHSHCCLHGTTTHRVHPVSRQPSPQGYCQLNAKCEAQTGSSTRADRVYT